MQDDDADKQEFFPQMDLIFGFASLTIVAASGGDADAGLPGIKKGSRTRMQIPFKIAGVSLLQTLDPEESGRESSYIGESVWYKRGWTFQEKIFSGRALIFTPEQVYWECQKTSWCEDGHWEALESPTIYRHSFGDLDFRRPWPSDVDGFERIYRLMIEEYSLRTLTFGYDGLDAFAGVLNALKRDAGQDYLWALPKSFQRNALTWRCEGESVKRRKEMCTVRSSDGTITKCHFPSWSWVGWVGKVDYPWVLNLKTHLDLIFYYVDGSLDGSLDGSGLPKLVQATAATQTLSQSYVWKHDSRTIVSREDIPENVDLSRSIHSNVLFFWSSTAKVDFRNGESCSCNGKVVRGVWFHAPGHEELEPGHEELVVIGKFAIHMGKGYYSDDNDDNNDDSINNDDRDDDYNNDYSDNKKESDNNDNRDDYNDSCNTDDSENSNNSDNMKESDNEDKGLLAVLLVYWKHGVAYRQGLVYIQTSDWVELDNRVWKLISLG